MNNYLINTTFVTERFFYDELISWLKLSFTKKAVESGVFTNPRIARVLSDEDVENVSVACELTCDSLSQGTSWIDMHFQDVLNEMSEEQRSHTLFFTTCLKIEK